MPFVWILVSWFVAPCLLSYTLAAALLSKSVLGAILQCQGHLAASVLPDPLSLASKNSVCGFYSVQNLKKSL